MSSAWRIVPFNLEESFHWPASHLHLLFHWVVDGCQGVPVSEVSLTYIPQLCPQALQQTFVVQTHDVDHYPTMSRRPTTPFHRTNWVCGYIHIYIYMDTPVKEHSAATAVIPGAPPHPPQTAPQRGARAAVGCCAAPDTNADADGCGCTPPPPTQLCGGGGDGSCMGSRAVTSSAAWLRRVWPIGAPSKSKSLARWSVATWHRARRPDPKRFGAPRIARVTCAAHVRRRRLRGTHRAAPVLSTALASTRWWRRTAWALTRRECAHLTKRHARVVEADLEHL